MRSHTMYLTVVASIAALAFAGSALALGGSAYAQIAADWGTPGTVHVTVVSNHTFRGTVTTTCGTVASQTKVLDAWVFNAVIHQNQDDLDFDISAAGSGANCTITVMDGHKLLAQKQFVST